LGRVIQIQGVGAERKRLLRMIVISLRELVKQDRPDSASLDAVAFIVLALEDVADTIERTVTPWEKRDYWVKADRFRREWEWAGEYGKELRQVLMEQDWTEIAVMSAKISAKLSNIQVSPRHRMGTPWDGAWKRLKDMENDKG